ncbi:hypothetical protein TNCV_549281 [Trichonephila clavipes]|nr:hypothetical protein TNCV_549281 [Trichonephila clavipes]
MWETPVRERSWYNCRVACPLQYPNLHTLTACQLAPHLNTSLSNYLGKQIANDDFHYTRAFSDGPRNFEPWSSDVDDT